MDKDLLPYIQGLTFAGASVFVAYFLWWKTKLHDELVKPDLLLLNKDIECMNARIVKLESKTDLLSSSFDEKVSEIKEEITEIKEMLANLNGKVEIFLEQRVAK